MLRESGMSSPRFRQCPLVPNQSPYIVRKFAEDVVAPKVREMDESEMMDKSIIKGLFEQGVRHSSLPYPPVLT